MAKYDSCPININDKSNEENLAVTKSYLSELAGQLNYDIDRLESRIETLESEISNLIGEGDD